MVIAAIIIGILFVILFFIASTMSDKKGEDFDLGMSMSFMMTLLVIIELVIIVDINKTPQPTAMDVYQGKTTLEYKVIDDVKVDSVVIFKNIDYGKN